MHFGLSLPQSGRPEPSLADVAIAAERAGFHSLWGFDRLLVPLEPRTPYPATADGSLPEMMNSTLDPLVALSVAAAMTSTIRLGTSVLVAPWYPPLLLARAAASLDRLSDGRFELGLGVGWSVDEYEAAGVPMTGRGRRLEEVLDVLTAAWTESVVTTTTSRERIVPSIIGLKPHGERVPVLLAAFTPAGLDRVARRADGWIPAGIPVDIAAGMWQGVCDSAERYGRDSSLMRLVVLANITITDELPSGRPEFVGSMRQVSDDISRCAEQGVHEVILGLNSLSVESSDVMIDCALELTCRTAEFA